MYSIAMNELRLVLADGVDRDDVRVLKARDDTGLAAEALALVVAVGAEDLERDLPAQARVHGQVDRAHAALSEHPDDLVVADARGQRVHGGTGHRRPIQG